MRGRIGGLCAFAVVALLALSGSASATTYDANAGSLGAIPDGTATSPGSYGAPRDVTFTVGGLPNNETPINVAVRFAGTHTFLGDLDVQLIAPDGTTKATIFSRTGAASAGAAGSEADVGGPYTFTDKAVAAPTWWTAAAGAGSTNPVPSGVYRMSTAGGAGGTGANATITPTFGFLPSINGTWTLRFRDGFQGDTGSITSASLDLTTAVPATPASLGAIPDGTLTPDYGPPRDVTFPIGGLADAAPGDISLSMTLNHTYVGDLDVVLIAPDGTTQGTVFSRTGATSASAPGNFSDLNGTYRFFDAAQAGTSWWTAAANNDPVPPNGYRTSSPGGQAGGGTPTTLTSQFSSVTRPNGTWTLRLRDHQAIDTGSITAASLKIVPGTDTSAPAAPVFAGSDPASPSSSNTPKVKGTAEAGSTVRIYADGFCSGVPIATGTAAEFGGAGIAASVDNDSSNQLGATAFDSSGNVSDCTSVPLSYVEDSTAPDAPMLAGLMSPANDNFPEIGGSGAEAGSMVRIYDNATCTPPVAASGSAASFNGPGITIEVPDDSTTTFAVAARDAAGNQSPCSNTIDYTEDSSSPTPALTGTSPGSPANENFPKLRGSGAEAGSTVTVFGANDCSGPPLFTGPAADFNGAGIAIEQLDDDTETYTVHATDPIANVSGCSNAITYVEDSTAPALPTLAGTSPAAAANENSPKVTGSAEAGSQVKLFTSADCTGSPVGSGTAAQLASVGIAGSVPDNATTQLRATATDAAGNASGCSQPVSFTEDSRGPTVTIGAKPNATVKTKRKTAPFSVSFTADESTTFRCALDKAAPAGCSSPFTGKAKKGRHTVTITATDVAGNPSVDVTVAWAVKRKKPRR